MVKGTAYLILALLIVAVFAFLWLTERARDKAVIDRRLEAMALPGVEPVNAVVAVTVPERIAPLLALVTLLVAGPAETLIVLLGVPALAYSWLKSRAGKRVDALTEALPLYLDSVRQLQAVGNSLSQAIERSLADAPEIIRSYFATAGRKLAMGAPVAETIQHTADRLQIPEVSMLAAAIRTNLRYGGSIATVFMNLAHILRERVRIRQELVAATSEAKVSSRVLIGMPLVAMALLMFINPSYITFFTSDPRGLNLAMWAGGLEVLGIVVIRRMMRLEF